jgi:hypothetical protein
LRFPNRPPRPPPSLLLPRARVPLHYSPASPALLSTAAGAAPPAAAVQAVVAHLLLPLPPRVVVSLPWSCFSPMLSCCERATASRASAGRHLAAAMFRAHARLISLPLLLSRTSRRYPIHFHLLFVAVCTLSPSTTAALPSSLPVIHGPPWTATPGHPLPSLTP